MPGSLTIRPAAPGDADELARLRWDFSPDDVAAGRDTYPDFLVGFRRFWSEAAESGRWTVWVAEHEGRLVGNIWVEHVAKVPRPGRSADEYGYVTNVYVEPEWRNAGIGTSLLQQVLDWAQECRLEFLIVWPSEESVAYYRRQGFAPSTEALELPLEGGCRIMKSETDAPNQ
jgi:GNAT superfamily N-acetyltransferase